MIQKDGHVSLRVADEGVGFDPGAVDQRCFGLAGIRERARVLGGSAKIDSAPGRPTTIEVQLPIVVSDVDDPIDSTD